MWNHDEYRSQERLTALHHSAETWRALRPLRRNLWARLLPGVRRLDVWLTRLAGDGTASSDPGRSDRPLPAGPAGGRV